MKQFKQNGTIATARAFATYSLVPYLGIIFCPGAVIVGGFSLLRSYRNSELNERASSFFCIAAGSIVLILQLLLWWILYKVPEWARGV